MTSNHKDNLLQIGRFGTVGILATFLHVSAAFVLHFAFSLSPLTANFWAYIFAWAVSYFGHYHWTFTSGVEHRQSIPRFLLISTAAFALNQAIVWLISEHWGQSFILAMAFVIVVIPATTYFASKFWAFRDA